MHVTCPISRDEEDFWSRTKKQAQDNAALVFMETFFNHGDNVQSKKSHSSPESTIDSLKKRIRIMQKKTPEAPLSILINAMQHIGIRPRFSLTRYENAKGVVLFMMRVTCPIVPGGPALAADGPYSLSKQVAKHSAALAFMEKYLSYENNVQPVTTHATSQPITAIIHTIKRTIHIMQGKTPEVPLSILNNAMQQIGQKPTFSLIRQDFTEDGGLFMMRVTCPILPGGPALSVDGPYSPSEQEAKHSAARAFIDKYLSYENNCVQPVTTHARSRPVVDAPIILSGKHDMQEVSSSKNSIELPEINKVGVSGAPSVPSTSRTNPKPAIDVVMSRSEEHEMLEAICLKKELGKPEIEDICVTGLAGAPSYVAGCKVSDLYLRANGDSRNEARMNAAVKMIQLLTGTASIYEILKSPKLTTAEMQLVALKSYHNEMISSNDSQTGSRLSVASGMNDKNSVDVKLPEKFTVRKNPDTIKSRIEFMSARKKAGTIIDGNNNNSDPKVSRRRLAKDFQHETISTKPSGASLSNNVPDCVQNQATSTSSDDFSENWTSDQQAVSLIDRTLENVEKQLHAEILKAIAYWNLSHRQTVAIFSHEYEVFIHENSPPKIFGGNIEIKVQSIRVACLTELLMCSKKGSLRAKIQLL